MGETTRGEGPIAVNSKLTYSNLTIEGQDALIATNKDGILTETLKDFWETEAIGIKDFPQQKIKESFKINVTWNRGCYKVKLPWEEDCLPPTSDNYQLCESWLKSLHHKLCKDLELLVEYDNTTLFPGSLLFSPPGAREERPWLGLVMCLPESGRLKINNSGEGSVKFVSIWSERPLSADEKHYAVRGQSSKRELSADSENNPEYPDVKYKLSYGRLTVWVFRKGKIGNIWRWKALKAGFSL